MRLNHDGYSDEHLYFFMDSPYIAMALAGGHEAMITYALEHSSPSDHKYARYLMKQRPIPDAWRLQPSPILMHMGYNDEDKYTNNAEDNNEKDENSDNDDDEDSE